MCAIVCVHVCKTKRERERVCVRVRERESKYVGVEARNEKEDMR